MKTRDLLTTIITLICFFLSVGVLILASRKEAVSSWTITSYSSVTGNPAMIYSIVDSKNRLIIVDGGWEEDADNLKRIISEHDNHVYAWIITHPHPDHAGAFNIVMSSSENIIVDDIYVTNLDFERYKETAAWYDVFETCEKYYSIIQELDNVHVLKEGDSFECLDLSFEIIHGWDGTVNKFSNNLCNKGSLMFMVSGREEQMLFGADTEAEVEDYIISRHSEQLKNVKYIQAAHHGNWGLKTDFYDIIQNPKVVFFDSGDNLLQPGDLGYDAGKLKAYFESRGATVYNYSSSPNSIVLK